MMPTIRFFKIGVNFDMVRKRVRRSTTAPTVTTRKRPQTWNQAQEITEEEKEIIREMQEDLPLVSRPFDPIAEKLGMTTAELFSRPPISRSGG